MKIVKNIFTTCVNIISKPVYFFASFASILGVVLLLFNGENWTICVVLGYFCILMTTFTICLIYALFRMLDVRAGEHENRSTFVKYENIDGNRIIYETYKLIQCKKTFMNEFEYKFKWSGTILPRISSDMQIVGSLTEDETKYDKVILKFKTPIYYNQNSIIHFKAELDDTDKASEPYVESRVDKETDVIHFRVILKNKSNEFGSNAILEKKLISPYISTEYKKIREIPFDKITKSYEYHLLAPEIGYFYRIRWEKNRKV